MIRSECTIYAVLHALLIKQTKKFMVTNIKQFMMARNNLCITLFMNNKKQTKIKGLKMPAYGKFMENHTMNESGTYK